MKGPIYRAAPNYVMISDPKYIHEAHKWNRSDWFVTLDPQVGMQSTGTARTMEQHNQMRRRIAPAYNPDSMYEMESKLDKSLVEFQETLRTRFAVSGKICNIGDYIHWFAFDAVMDLAFSHRIGFVKEGKDVGLIIHSLLALFDTLRFLTTYPGLQKFINHKWVAPILSSKPTDDSGPGLMAIKEVQRRLKHGSSGNKKDLLDRFIEYKNERGVGIPPRELEVDAFTPIIAGPESVATLLRAAVLYIVTNPRVHQKLTAELDEKELSGSLSTPISYQETKQLPYLCAVVKEMFRIHPPIGTPFPRVVPQEGITICGHFIPGGCDVGRNKQIFGDDVDRFRPERWLEATRDELREFQRADLTFGAGLTTCLGKHIAAFEIHKTLAELFRNFHVEMANPIHPCEIDNMFAFLFHDMNVYLSLRSTG
ncbi:cytochrome P450 [Penicillium frequentans]|uniref:Cytochrome P450 n=1 Tax=Penicillium frequentans TaxID=3151616 RepID=A0AAD6D5S7_9EURO|nr:cytochrome P450 [Penicillium glabrum]